MLMQLMQLMRLLRLLRLMVTSEPVTNSCCKGLAVLHLRLRLHLCHPHLRLDRLNRGASWALIPGRSGLGEQEFESLLSV